LHIKRILVANRGEVALRIMRTMRETGRQSVAIYSEADAGAPFVRYADEALPLKGYEARDTYLSIEKIVSAGRDAHVEAIHPGYGFLSENPEFVRAVEEAGIVFVGPGHEAVRLMGDKIEARKLVRRYGVPIIPGTEGPVLNLEEARRVAGEISYPILIKAAAGGGGKGMRLVEEEKELESSLRAARSESMSAFGDDRVFIEKYVRNPRHIEFQILADRQGHVVHLFERECSVQRRHQKVIEEAPSTALTSQLREEMGKAAVNAARACGYANAGTVEFVLGEDGKYYFLEMNTRLQVEHPITELTTGIDLVREQIELAEGKELSISQDRISRRGHSIECRIYAEDVLNDFLPDTGKIEVLREPVGSGVRLDSGVESGSEISVYYDPMIAKLSVWDLSREGAIKRMLRALNDYVLLGPKTTIPFCRFVLQSEDFRSGHYSTDYVNEHRSEMKATLERIDAETLDAALVLAGVRLRGKSGLSVETGQNCPPRSRWLDGRFES
jgi:acetyl-CoA carboxylase biotin carboxylase subunit